VKLFASIVLSLACLAGWADGLASVKELLSIPSVSADVAANDMRYFPQFDLPVESGLVHLDFAG